MVGFPVVVYTTMDPITQNVKMRDALMPRIANHSVVL
jgi:hypothetical protein